MFDEEKELKNISRSLDDQHTEKVIHDVNFHEEPILSKEELMDFDNIVLPKFLIPRELEKSRRQKVSKVIQVSSVPQIMKEPSDKESFIYQFDIQEKSDINLYLKEIHKVKV